ncbi:MAG TPA: SPOR domain-containing protein [Povalibacter sp.]
MERHVKERLIGAAVLVAAAVILVPEMLSGPDHETHDTAPAVSGDAPLKTYTIDLSRPSASLPGGASAVIPDQAPPPEVEPDQTEPAVTDQQIPEPDAADLSAEEIVRPPTESAGAPAHTVPPVSSPAVPSAQANRETAPVPQAVPAPVVRENGAATAGWAVQLGSFGSQAKANNMAANLRGEGYDAFVMPVKTGTGTLYRVRIGPMGDREAAARTLAKIKPKVVDAKVVKHP